MRKASAPKIAPIGAALAARKGYAAKHDRGDREERVGVAARKGRFAGVGEEGEKQTADRGKKAGQRIGSELARGGSVVPDI